MVGHPLQRRPPRNFCISSNSGLRVLREIRHPRAPPAAAIYSGEPKTRSVPGRFLEPSAPLRPQEHEEVERSFDPSTAAPEFRPSSPHLAARSLSNSSCVLAVHGKHRRWRAALTAGHDPVLLYPYRVHWWIPLVVLVSFWRSFGHLHHRRASSRVASCCSLCTFCTYNSVSLFSVECELYKLHYIEVAS